MGFKYVFQVGEHTKVLQGAVPGGSLETPCLFTPAPILCHPIAITPHCTILALYISIWQFPSCVFYNTSVLVSKKFLMCSLSYSSMLLNWEGAVETRDV